MFGAVLAVRYENVELNKAFDVFQEKIINYVIKEPKNAEGVLMLTQDLVDTKYYFDVRNEPKVLTIDVSRSEAKKEILAARVRQYIYMEVRLYSNLNIIYGIIWGKCTKVLQSVLKDDKEYPTKSNFSFYMTFLRYKEDHRWY